MTNLLLIVVSLAGAAVIAIAARWFAGWLTERERAQMVAARPQPTPPATCFTEWGLTSCPGNKRCYSKCAVEGVVKAVECGRAARPDSGDMQQFRALVKDPAFNADFVPVVAEVLIGTVDPIRAALHAWDNRA